MSKEVTLILKNEEEKAVCKYALERMRSDLSKKNQLVGADGYKDVCDDLISRIVTASAEAYEEAKPKSEENEDSDEMDRPLR